MRIYQRQAVPQLDILQDHCLQQRRFPSDCFPDDMYAGKPVFGLNAENAPVVSKINASKADNVVWPHHSSIHTRSICTRPAISSQNAFVVRESLQRGAALMGTVHLSGCEPNPEYIAGIALKFFCRQFDAP